MATLSARTPKRSAFAVSLAVVAASLLCSCGNRIEVETTSPRRGRIEESFTEPSRTRLANTYPIIMPLDLRVGRIVLEPGDAVKKGEELVTLDRVPVEQSVAEAEAAVAELRARIKVKEYNKLEETARIEAETAIEAALEVLKAAEEQVQAEKARSDHANKELERVRQLAEKNAVPESDLDAAQLTAETALIELRKQEFNRAALKAMIVIVKLGPDAINDWLGRKTLEKSTLKYQLAQTEARLAGARHELKLAEIRSPINGIVLERYEQGGGPVSAGTPLLLLGNLRELEVVADVLTQDAMKLSSGSRGALVPSTYFKPIPGKVKRIEPYGFTKLSSLGVEQQRVRVIVELTEPPDTLKVGYRLQARFFTGSQDKTLIVPRFSVLQEPDGSFYVLKVAAKKLKKQIVKIGLRSDLELQVLEGLSESDEIVRTPSAALQEGVRVRIRQKRNGE